MRRALIRSYVRVLALLSAWLALPIACTPGQRAIVRTVTDIAEAVCGEADSPAECLTKCQVEADRRGAKK